ncbi:MAG: hypothetical protein JNL13_13940 [Chitinophagaceae bacterium]|nr:hypothetical protein [Chitinophagaceae bacterium]
MLKLLHEAALEQDSNSVVHHLPPCLPLLGDSLVCMKLSATNFTVYNYFTGRILQRLSVDTLALPGLLAKVQEKINPKYTLITAQQSKEVGATRTRIESIVYNKEQGKYFLFFDAAFCLDSPMVYKGKSEPFNWISSVPFVTILDAQRNGTNQYVLLDYGASSPNFSYGGFLIGDKVIVPNYAPERAVKRGFGMLCSIDLADTGYLIRDLNLPFDERMLNLQRQNRTEKVCFAAADGVSYYLAIGNKVLYSKDGLFQEVYRMDTSENIYELYFNRSRKLLFLNTFSRDNNKMKGIRVFSLDLETKALNTFYSGAETAVVQFINDSALLKLSENADQQKYEFAVYTY